MVIQLKLKKSYKMNTKIIALLIVVGVASMFNVAEASSASDCSLPAVVGRCKAAIPRWAFQNGKCEEFIYGGCGGNGNNFHSKAECQKVCG